MNQAAKIALLKSEYSQDSIGQWTETRDERNVFAYVSSVSMVEFYNAGLQGFKPEYRMLVWRSEYEGEELLTYKDKTYTIYRTYERDDGRIELYVTERKGAEV